MWKLCLVRELKVFFYSIKLNWVGLDWIGLNWIELNWIALDFYIPPNIRLINLIFISGSQTIKVTKFSFDMVSKFVCINYRILSYMNIMIAKKFVCATKPVLITNLWEAIFVYVIFTLVVLISVASCPLAIGSASDSLGIGLAMLKD